MTHRQPQDQPGRRPLPAPVTPPQWQQGAPPRQGIPRGPQPQYRPRQDAPPPGYGAQSPHGYHPRPAPQRQPPAAPLRRQRPAPRYPRFPRVMPRSRRGPSLFHMVYLGTHPVALLVSLLISLMLFEVWLMVVMIAGFFWLLHCGIVAVQRAAARRG